MNSRHGRSFSKKIWRSLPPISRRTFATSSPMEKSTQSQLLEFLSNADLKKYELTNFRVTMLNPDAAIVTYNVDARAVIREGDDDAHCRHIGLDEARRQMLNVSAVASARS